MSKPIKAKINVKLIDKTKLFRAQSGAVYLDLVVFALKSEGQYGDTHIIKQQAPEGEDMPIIGNLTIPGFFEDDPPPQEPNLTPQGDEEDIPF